MSELRRFALEGGSDLGTLITGLEQRAPFERDPDEVIERTVYDTFDWRIRGAGTELEHERRLDPPRPSTRRSTPTSAPGGDAWLVWRSTDTGEVLGRLRVDRVPAFPGELPAAPLTDRLADIVEMRALLPLVTLRSERSTLRLLDDEGKTGARVVIDRTWAPGHDEPSDPVVEVLPVRGYPRAAEQVIELLAAQVVLRPIDQDAVDDALTKAGLTPGGYSSKLKVEIDPDSNALDAVVTVLDALLDTMRANEPGTRADIDSEFLHDYRVAVRRSRSVLGMAKHVVPKPLLDDLRAEFKWLGDVTTPTRDLDVYLLTYDDFEDSLPEPLRPDLRPLHSFLAKQQALAQAQLAADLDSPRYAALLDRYQSWLADPRAAPGATDAQVAPDAELPATEFAAERTWKAYRSLVKDGRRITDDTPPPEVHELRKDGKKLRYALECFGSLFPVDEVAPLVKELKGVQDVLGDFQDAEVQKSSLRHFGEALVAESGTDSAPTLMAMGYLIEQLDERERDARDQFAERFARFDSHSNRARSRALFAPPAEEPTE